MTNYKNKSLSASACIVFTCFLNTFTNAVHANNQALNDYDETATQVAPSHSHIVEQVAAFIEDKILAAPDDDLRINVKAIDKRISIPYCAQAYELSANSITPQQSNISVKVTCPSTNWYLFTHATVAVIKHVVVAKESLSPGTLLTTRNTSMREVDKNKLRGSVFTHHEDVIGARVKRRLRAGNIISDNMLCFVCKGDRVTIAANAGGLSIKVYGIAQEDGVLGDTIQVRNISSDKLVYARIASTSQVNVAI